MAKPMPSEGMDLDSDEDCFSKLRRIAGNVDRGVSEVQSRIETWNDEGLDNLDETPSLLFLHHAHKDTKEISAGAKRIRKDFTMRSSTMNSVSDLFASALESFKERLETVETFTEQYGYKRPVPASPPQSNSDSDEVLIENSNSESEICVVNLDNNCENPSFSSADEKMRKLSDPHTPRLEDIGLSEHTLFDLKAGNYNMSRNGENVPLRNKDIEKEKTDSLPCQSYEPEISTPKLESYGMSKHALMFLDTGRMASEKENLCLNDSSPDFCFLKSMPPLVNQMNNKLHATPVKRQLLVMENSRKISSPVSFQSPVKTKMTSSTAPDFYSSSRQRNQDSMSTQKYATVSSVDPDSPRTPPLPELTTHFFMDPPKIAKPIPERRSYDSPKTPPLPDLQTCVLTEIDLPKGPQIKDERNDPSLYFTEKTPPFPKLSSRYF